MQEYLQRIQRRIDDLGREAEGLSALAEDLQQAVAEAKQAVHGQRELPGIGAEPESPAGERGLRDRIRELEGERERQAGQIARLVRENAELRAGRMAPGQAAD